jgi:hypothetical protein
MVCLRNICINTLHKGDSDYHDNNNNEEEAVVMVVVVVVIVMKGETKSEIIATPGITNQLC